MAQATISPPLYIQQQRHQDSHRLVVAGPTGRNARWVWTLPKGQQVRIYLPHQPATSYLATIDRPSVSVQSSTEIFGFDPTTSRYPRLRRIQQYSTLVLRGDNPNLIGAIVAPAEPLLRVSSVRATLSLNLPRTTDTRFLNEVATDTGPDHLVWRYQGETGGYLVTDLSVLVTGSPLTLDLLLIHLAEEEPCQQFQLYGMLPQRLEGQVDLAYSEEIVGEAKVAAQVTVP